MAVTKTVTPTQEVAAGVIAGVADALACHPVDVIKTQWHVNKGTNGSMFAELRAQAAQGGVRRLYRGVLPACTRPQALCMYTGNEWCKRLVAGTGELNYRTAPLAGFLTGYVESACVTPFEVVKVRMQTKQHLGRYTSSLQCGRRILAEEGIRALYNGFGATCARNCTFNGIYFGVIFVAEDILPRRESTVENIAQNLGTGCLAGCAATCVKAPFDVVKSRIQNQIPDAQGNVEYRHTTQALLRILRTEGPLGLYKGFTPMLARIVLGMSISYAAFDAALAWMQQSNESHARAAVAAAAAAADEAAAAAASGRPPKQPATAVHLDGC